MTSQASIRTLAKGIITDEAHPEGAATYIENWFGASGFFGTQAWHGPYYGRYFITRDAWMSTTIYAARKITPTGIDTLEDGNGNGCCDSHEEAMQLIEADAE